MCIDDCHDAAFWFCLPVLQITSPNSIFVTFFGTTSSAALFSIFGPCRRFYLAKSISTLKGGQFQTTAETNENHYEI